ncbi:hypothetical protein [Emergencia timonensis]|uniref:hypothetical protein n=1 Tax=Emergencia timonensis TaxID=1776384 RepID=UPI00266C2F7C|nr:hypothetical protein [Emergencia timonensis]
MFMHKSRRGVEPARARAVAHQFCELVRSERSKQPVLGCAGRQSASSLQADCVTPLGDTNTEKQHPSGAVFSVLYIRV